MMMMVMDLRMGEDTNTEPDAASREPGAPRDTAVATLDGSYHPPLGVALT